MHIAVDKPTSVIEDSSKFGRVAPDLSKIRIDRVLTLVRPEASRELARLGFDSVSPPQPPSSQAPRPSTAYRSWQEQNEVKGN